MPKVLYLVSTSASYKQKRMITAIMMKAGFKAGDILFKALTPKAMKRKGKSIWYADPMMKPAFENALDSVIASLSPDVIMCQDRASLGYITDKYISLDKCRGSVYYYGTVPVIVTNDISKVMTKNEGSWLATMDALKCHRWATGQQHKEPSFGYSVARHLEDIQAFYALAKDAAFMSIDIETTGTLVSCVGYTILTKDGRAQGFVIPFFNPTIDGGCHWSTAAEEVTAWELVAAIHKLPVYKVMQNGSYDSAYFIKYRIPPVAYLFDTLHMWHSIWPEAPKRLDVISSVLVDFMQYWKDEGKAEDEDDNKKQKISVVPSTVAGIEKYWKYNALDTHTTLIAAVALVKILSKLEWAADNYKAEFKRQIGACLSMSMRGIKVDEGIQAQLMTKLSNASTKAMAELAAMVDDKEFNPNSPPQVQELLYDILKAKELPRKGRTTDQTVLKLLQTQSVLLDKIISQIWAAKKPKNNVSKYSNCTMAGRFMYKLHAATTPTGRLASKAHDFWTGSNIQNVPKSMRCMMEADPGHVLLDIDYSQSDAYFTAFESEDSRFIETMLSGKDTHCVHAAQFFKIDYAKILKATTDKEPWAVDALHGIRNITKRVVYGCNYFMQGYTLFVTMGIQSVVTAAKFLGHKDAHKWTAPQYAKFCDTLIQSYYDLYPGIQSNILQEAALAKQRGNKARCAFGYTRMFFGDLVGDDKRQRELAAFYGQGGTAGNINKAIDNIFYGLETEGVRLMFQVHDSLVLQIPENSLSLVPRIVTAMENTCTVKGKSFVVPVEVDIGRGWGSRLMSWNPNTAIEQIDAHEAAWKAKWAKDLLAA